VCARVWLKGMSRLSVLNSSHTTVTSSCRSDGSWCIHICIYVCVCKYIHVCVCKCIHVCVCGCVGERESVCIVVGDMEVVCVELELRAPAGPMAAGVYISVH